MRVNSRVWPSQLERRFRRQLARDGLLEPLDGFAHRVALGEVGRDLDRAQAVEPRELHRARRLLELHDARQRNQLVGARRAHADVGEIRRRLADVVATLQDDVVLAAAIDVRRHDARAEHGLERAPDALERDAEVGRAIAVDRHADLRLALFVVALDVREAGIRLRELQHLVRPYGEPLVVRSADDGDDGRLQAAAPQAAGHAHRHAHAGQLARLGEHGLHDLARRVLALVPVLEDQERARRVDVAGAQVVAALARHAHEHALDVAAFAHVLHGDRLELPRVAVDVLEARALGPFDADEAAAVVRLRRELGGHGAERHDADADQHRAARR